MLSHVGLVRTDVSEELSASFIRMTRIGEVGTRLAVTSNRRMLQISFCPRISATAYINFSSLIALETTRLLAWTGYGK
jgi:hypothetical protein